MKKALLFVPIGAAAVGAAVFFAMKKPAGEKPAAEKKTAAKSGGKKEKAAKPKALKSGSYTFISGFKDASKVEMTVQYDSNVYSYAVIEEEFPAYSSDSHVAVIYGEDFDMQLEYAGYYGGEDFGGLAKSVAERYKGFGEVSYGDNRGVKYVDGDNVCLCIPVPNDEFSYVLATIMKGKEYDEPFETLVDHPDVKDIIASMRFSASK